MLLVAGVLGLEVLAADAGRDGPGGVLLGPDPERPGRLAAAGHLEPLAGLAGRRLPFAVLAALLLALTLFGRATLDPVVGAEVAPLR